MQLELGGQSYNAMLDVEEMLNPRWNVGHKIIHASGCFSHHATTMTD